MTTEARQNETVPDWTLGWRLQRSLAHAGISVSEMAGELEVSRATLSRWMNDHGAPPRAIYLRQWALRCGVSYAWLTGNPQNRDKSDVMFSVSAPRWAWGLAA